MNHKHVFGILAALLVSTAIHDHALCASTQASPQIIQKPFHDGGMDADEENDDAPINDTEQTADSLNDQSLEDSQPHQARTTVGIAYVSVHVIDHIQDSDFPKVVASARKAIGEAKKDDADFSGKTLISAVRKSMMENHRQSDKFMALMKDYKVERPEQNDVVLDELPESIGCSEDAYDENDSEQPPSYCYNFSITPKSVHGKNVISINGNTVWQGSDADQELDSDQYHVDLANTKTAWFYRGLPADANGTKRLFLFEVTVAADPDKLTVH